MRVIATHWTMGSGRTLAGCLFCMLVPVFAWAQPPGQPAAADTAAVTASPAEIQKLIAGLADDNFQVRQNSEYRLKQIGHAAIPWLELQRHAGDSELRLASIRLIGILRRDYMASQTRRFLAGEISLPGWDLFSEVAGDRDETRELFAELFKNRPQFLRQFDQDPTPQLTLKKMLTESAGSRHRRADPDSLLMAAVSMQIIKTFSPGRAGADPPVPNPLQLKVRAFFNEPQFHFLFHKDPFKTLHRAAAIQWVTFDDGNRILLPSRLKIARQLQLAESLYPAIRCLPYGKQLPRSTRELAIVAVAKYGDRSHIELLAPYLDQTELFFSGEISDQTGNRVRYQTQTGDLVLASMVFLAGKEFREFGFTSFGLQDRSKPLPAKLAGFPSDAARQAAREKWKAFWKPPKDPS